VTIAALLTRTHAEPVVLPDPVVVPEPVVLDGRFRLDRQVSEQVGDSDGVSLWQATDTVLCRTVAVHLLPAWGPVPPGLAKAVQASARVNDARLAPIFDIGYSAGSPFIVSEWAGDPDLEDLLLAGVPSPALAAHIVTEAAAALSIAHASGRPHLRLGLRSLHWGSSGLKITGLGIDAALSGADPADQADPADLAATDTVALARILYALLTGYWPGGGAAPEPRQLRADVPPVLSAIACQALPGWGPPSIRTPGELATALRAAQPALPDAPPVLSALVPPARPAPAAPAAGRGHARHARSRADAGRRPAFA
jgi:hypothetical protein